MSEEPSDRYQLVVQSAGKTTLLLYLAGRQSVSAMYDKISEALETSDRNRTWFSCTEPGDNIAVVRFRLCDVSAMYVQKL